MTSRRSWLGRLAHSDRPPMALRNQRTRAVLADVIEPAFDGRSRRQGLLRRDALPRGHALVLAPCAGVHTCFMRFAIDVVFVRSNGEIVRIATELRPWRMAVAVRAHAAIELPGGVVISSGTRAGDFLELVVMPATGL